MYIIKTHYPKPGRHLHRAIKDPSTYSCIYIYKIIIVIIIIYITGRNSYVHKLTLLYRANVWI